MGRFQWDHFIDVSRTVFSYRLYLLRPPWLRSFRVFPREWSKKERTAVQSDKTSRRQLSSLRCPYQHPQLYRVVSHYIFVFSLCSRYYSQQLGSFLFLQVRWKKKTQANQQRSSITTSVYSFAHPPIRRTRVWRCYEEVIRQSSTIWWSRKI